MGIPRKPVSKWLTRGVPALAVATLLVLVWAFGGFQERTDQRIDVAAGHTVTIGDAFQLKFTRATIQKQPGYGKSKSLQSVVAYGTAANIWTKSQNPEGEWFYAAIPGQPPQRGQSATLDVGDNTSSTVPEELAPGLGPKPFKVEFQFPANTQPSPKLGFGFTDVDYGNHDYFSSSGSQTWGSSNSTVYRMKLPLTVLPANKF